MRKEKGSETPTLIEIVEYYQEALDVLYKLLGENREFIVNEKTKNIYVRDCIKLIEEQRLQHLMFHFGTVIE